MCEKKRYTLGVLIGGVHTYFPKEHITGIIAAAKELDVNICFFLGTRAGDFFEGVLNSSQQNTYDYQFNTLHDYSLVSGVDGLIINFGTLGIYMKDTDPERFAQKFNRIPVVYLSEIIRVPNCHSLICDNRQGIRLIVEHLIQEHHCRKILFMTGPEHNTDAIERRQAYFDTMKQYGLPVSPQMLAIGDYSEFVDPQVEELLDRNPDAEAIVFSNDQMAFAGYRVCERRGLQVGKDILITGYDDCELAAGMNPPLTTVLQDGVLMGRMAVYDLVEQLEGDEVSSRRVPVTLVARESCGCAPVGMKRQDSPKSLAAEVQRLNGVVTQMKQELINFQCKSWFIPLLARDLNDCREDEYTFCLKLMAEIDELHHGSNYLFLLEEPVSHREEEEWHCPDTLLLAAFSRNGKATAYREGERPVVSRGSGGFYPLMEDGQQHQFMVFLLFSGERQYGLLACDIEEEEFPFFYVISLQVGLSLRYLEISKAEAARRLAMSHDMESLRERNRTLGTISFRDKLTGLLNLRGFLDRAERLCQEAEKPRRAYMIYADLDHLKEINDSWGHAEGNYALTAAADILKSCLRSGDILARVGGDEFTGLVLSGEPSFEAIFRARILRASRERNTASGKPYYVELSLGIVPFTLDSGTEDIQQVMADADRQLYEAKKQRRSSVRKA